VADDNRRAALIECRRESAPPLRYGSGQPHASSPPFGKNWIVDSANNDTPQKGAVARIDGSQQGCLHRGAAINARRYLYLQNKFVEHPLGLGLVGGTAAIDQLLRGSVKVVGIGPRHNHRLTFKRFAAA
jgi:hypothetical protein